MLDRTKTVAPVSFKLKSSATTALTQEVLEDFRKLPPSPTERELSEKRVKRLREKIETGRAIPFIWASAIVDGTEYRANGQHSAEALIQMNGTFPEGLIVHRDVYDVEGNEGLVHLFRQFDDRISGRSPTDTAGAFLKLESALVDLDLKVAKRAAEAIHWHSAEIEAGRRILGDDRYDIFHDDGVHPFLLWQGELFSIKTNELADIPVVAAMWATWQKNQSETRNFWDLVARGGVPGDDADATTQLDIALVDMKEKRREQAKRGDLYSGCIDAWNAWRAGNKPRSIKFDHKGKTFKEPVE